MLTADEKRATVARVTAGWAQSGHTYPQPLPAELRDWYAYTGDGGHSLLVALREGQARFPAASVEELLVPAPVRAVQRVGWTVDAEGYVWCDLPYDATLGLLTEPDDDEF